MHTRRGLLAIIYSMVAALALFTAASAAQTPHVTQPPANAPQVSAKDLASLQDQLLQELRVSPTLAEVVARDPSLLSNTEYVNRNNPELGRFLQAHPEIAQNPDFYLFNNLHGDHEQPSETLERKLWPQMSGPTESGVDRELINDGIPFLAPRSRPIHRLSGAAEEIQLFVGHGLRACLSICPGRRLRVRPPTPMPVAQPKPRRLDRPTPEDTPETPAA